jgi:1-deoxy-D-xylulose-5-phosphate synthase
MAPRDENELRRMMLSALRHDGPIAFRYPRGPAMGVPLEIPIAPIAIGKGKVLAKGEDVVLLAVGSAVAEALKARDLLAERGVQATVVDCRFVKPIDTELITDLARSIPRMVTVEENVRQGGFGSAILESLNDAGLFHVALQRIGVPDVFVEHGTQAWLRSKYGLDAKAITSAAFQLVQPHTEIHHLPVRRLRA